jgi:predicted phage tail component-like protein
MYFIKYNEIDLTDTIKVRDVQFPSLPSIEHSTINMFERDGNIFNGASYNNREIKLVLIIQKDTSEDFEIAVNDVKHTFSTKEEARLFCGDETLYMWCVPVDDITITELGRFTAEVEINLVAYNPYWYSTGENVVNSEEKQFVVENESDVPVSPTIQIGFNKDTTFVQVENQTSGKKILIGGLPTIEGELISRDSIVFEDEMETTTGWVSTSAPIDADRGTGGT